MSRSLDLQLLFALTTLLVSPLASSSAPSLGALDVRPRCTLLVQPPEVIVEHAPGVMVKQPPEVIAKHLTEIIVEHGAEAMPEPAPEAIAEHRLEAIAEHRLEAIAEHRLEAIAEHAFEAIAGHGPEAMADPAPEAIAEHALKAIAVHSLEATVEHSPEATAEHSLEAIVVHALEAIVVLPPETIAARSSATPLARTSFGRRSDDVKASPNPATTRTESDSSVPLGAEMLGQESEAARKDDPYPPERRASVVRFFALEGDVKPDVLRKVISELSTKDVESHIVGDPMVSSTRPGKHFVALETPAAVTSQDLEKALRKCSARVQALEWTLFRGAKQGPTPILGYSGRDCVIGMSSDLRWFDFTGEASSFYFIPSKLRGAKLADLYRKLYQPFGGGELGKVVRETIQWSIKAPVDDAVARRVEKAIAKIDGVREAKIDAATGSLRVTIECDGLKTSGPMGPSKDVQRVGGTGKVEHESTIAPRFDTNPLFEALAKEQWVIAPRKD